MVIVYGTPGQKVETASKENFLKLSLRLTVGGPDATDPSKVKSIFKGLCLYTTFLEMFQITICNNQPLKIENKGDPQNWMFTIVSVRKTPQTVKTNLQRKP